MKRFRKSYKKRNSKPLYRHRYFGLVTFFLLSLVVAGYVFNFHSFFQIKDIDIVGNEKISKEKIKEVVSAEVEKKILFFPSRSIFLADFNKIKKEILNDFPQVARVEIRRDLPDALRIKIVEKFPVAAWCQSDNCFLLDQNGVIFDQFSGEPAGLLKIKDFFYASQVNLGVNVISKQKLSQVLEIKNKLTEVGILAEEFSLVSAERLDVNVAQGWQVYFNFQENTDWQLAELTQLLEKVIAPEERSNLEYIDLRFEKVYFKMR